VKPDCHADPALDGKYPPSDEMAEFYAWVFAQANAESEGMPETELINNEGETLEV
jgi:hypothetical protein